MEKYNNHSSFCELAKVELVHIIGGKTWWFWLGQNLHRLSDMMASTDWEAPPTSVAAY
ncbi:hypothetical protein [Prolixibacter sp. SD074]|uniref:hypothetical protein n=1 Tax=Prolixibacter sp. SD074 TaxID=2652391 RepID=UPI00127F6209|nr:hypothetical protein [Prolixibacter sp. SD074]GET29939.1 hypothetical protein SD074_21410 [Prolixibacter sp. SD074]